MSEDIAIVGMAGRFPGAADVPEFWANQLAGQVTVGEMAPEELLAAGVPAATVSDPAYVPVRGMIDGPELFDAAFFGIAAKEADLMDPQHRLLLQTAWEALEDAGEAHDRPFGRIGIFAGAGFDYYLHTNVLTRPEEVENQGLLAITLGNEKDHLVTRIAHRLRLGGPAVTVQTACSTSLTAVHLACQSLRAGDSDLTLAGGVCVAVPQRTGYLHEPKGILSPKGRCRPFDAEADGTVPGNGVALVVLKRADDARRDGDPVYALIKGSAINNDGGGKVGYTAPSVSGQTDVLHRAYRRAGVAPATVGYLEAHGTATEVGDAIELAALSEVFDGPAGSCSLGSAKATVGHLDAAAGVTGLIRAALALHHRRIPPLAGLKQPRAELAGGTGPFVLDLAARDWSPAADGTPRRAGVSSFGIGGTNIHVVLEEAPEPAAAPEPVGAAPVAAVLPVSARTPQALRRAAERLAELLRAQPELPLHDVALTLQSHRRGFPHRLAVSALDAGQAATRLARAARGAGEALRRPSVVLLFPGQGSEAPGMSAGLYGRFPSFRADLDRGSELLGDTLGFDLREVLVRDDPRGLIHRTDVTQPALVLHEYALGRLLLSWGIRPAALIGHSIGEFAAAALTGELPLDEVLRLVALRGELMQGAAEGAMVVALADEATVRDLLPESMDIAAVNAPQAVVAAGPAPAMAEFLARLGAAGLKHVALPATRAFHSRMMTDAAARLGRAAEGLTSAPRRDLVISSLNGERLPQGGARPSGYWADQLRDPVRYHDAVRTAAGLRNPVFVEVGPGSALTGAAGRAPEAGGVPLVALQPRGRGRADLSDVLAGVGALWVAGVELDWAAVRAGTPARRTSLPGYPFDATRHWLDAGPSPTALAGTDPAAAVPAAAAEAPVTVAATPDAVLAAITEIWQEMLGGGGVDADSDFFGLGGESLLFIRMMARVRRAFGVELPVAELIRSPTPRALAGHVAAVLRAAGD